MPSLLCICGGISYLCPQMISNYFTLRHIALDLDKRLSRSVFLSAFSQSKNELILTFNNDLALVVSCDPALNATWLRGPFARARKNSVDFFTQQQGMPVLSVSIQPADREIILALENGASILIRLFGSKANVFQVNGRRQVLEAFLHPRETADRTLDQPHPAAPPLSQEEFEAKFRAIGHLGAFAVLKKLLPLYGSVLVREVLYRAGLSEERAVAELHQTEGRRIFDNSERLFSELGQPAPRVYFDGEHPSAFALIELHAFAHLRAERYESIHEAITVFVRSFHSKRGFIREQSSLEASIAHEVERLERTMAKMAEEQASGERASHYELYGKLLKAHLPLLQKGMDSINLENVFSPSREQIAIPLDPHLTGARNADRYFARAKKTRHSLEEAVKRRGNLHEHYDLLKRLSDALHRVQTAQAWGAFLDENAEQLSKAGLKVPRPTKSAQPLPPFRLFTVEGGFQVWAGKNSENNDLLTLKHARPNDLWFHARGSGGSHVVLRAGSGKGEVSKKAIEQAASIAAYYSKMKASRLVPVAMTLRKYVRKPRGAPAGTVAVEREKVLMVAPRLPGDASHRTG